LTSAVYIGVFAYGESRFNLTFDPCFANIDSLCPMNASVPISANGIIPIAPADVANIPPIALSIPDFEGQAILRVFANSTQSQIGCFSAVISNGSTFSHPKAIGSILGGMALIAFASSVAVAVYGSEVADTRKHYAHSMSVFVVFAVFHHIYFTGALSLNWPSVLVAFWSNYAWSAGMIYSESMQNSINKFIGNNGGNISMVGSAPSGQNNPGLGGGFSIAQIYKRAVDATVDTKLHAMTGLLRRDTASDNVSQFSWYGSPVLPGLPLPGNYSGFAGTLAPERISASNAFLTGFIWFLILLLIVSFMMILLKGCLEGLEKIGQLRTDRLNRFRQHWLRFVGAILLRACLIAFFMMSFLAMFQFTLGGSAGVVAIAAIVFVLFLLGLSGMSAYALYYRLRLTRTSKVEGKEKYGPLSVLFSRFDSSTSDPERTFGVESKEKHGPLSVLFSRFDSSTSDPDLPVHNDTDYLGKFGWLFARFRRSKWWSFAPWLLYELVRACFFGGAAGHAQTQVFGLLAWEIVSLAAIVWMRPFESSRLNFLMVYLLGFSKVVTVALSSAFDPRFGLPRILTTVLGVVIIVLQGILTIVTMVFIILGAISTYMSILRYRPEIRPRSWNNPRVRYFAHMDYKATDQPRPLPATPAPPPEPELPKEPYFAVTTVRREPKIEDDGEEVDPGEAKAEAETGTSVEDRLERAPSRTMSMRSSYSNLPYGARRHRVSWSTRDFAEYENDHQPQAPLHQRMSQDNVRDAISRHRASSLRGSGSAYDTTGFVATAQRAAAGKSDHRRTMSNPHYTKRRGSAVAEDDERQDS
jgi:hypothetical protein